MAGSGYFVSRCNAPDRAQRKIAAARHGDSALDRAGRRRACHGFIVASFGRRHRRLVLGADIAALDTQRAIPADADENTGPRDLGGIVDDGPLVQRRNFCLDLTETLVDGLRQLVGFVIVGLEPNIFRLQGLAAGLLCRRHLDGPAAQSTVTVGMPVGEVRGRGDPFPALRAQLFGRRLELRRHQAIEKRRVLEPVAVVMLEEIPHDGAASGFIGADADEPHALIPGPDSALRELASDEIWLLVVGTCQHVPDLLLPRMVVREGERHERLERHAVLGIDVEQLLGDAGEPPPLLDHGHVQEEPCRAICSSSSPFSRKAWKARNWSSGCRGARCTFSARESSSAMPLSRTTQGHGLRLAHPLLLDQQLKRLSKEFCCRRNRPSSDIVARHCTTCRSAARRCKCEGSSERG
jgi:hypothetical protein